MRKSEELDRLYEDSGSEAFTGSFRDPSGQLFRLDRRVVRVVEKSVKPELMAFLSSRAAQKFDGDGGLVKSRWLDRDEAHSILAGLQGRVSFGRDNVEVVEHERIPFPSFPYEWPAEMLRAAGNFTLDIAEALLDEGFGLKDATPYNILFRGCQPVFVDVSSAERREPNDPTWLPYAQFIRTFVLPLLANRLTGISPSTYLTGKRDGIEPEEVYRLLSVFNQFRPSTFTIVTLPVWLAKLHDSANETIYKRKLVRSASQARFVLRSMFRRLRKNLKTASGPERQGSIWIDYMESNTYSRSGFEAKRRFTEDALSEFRVKWLLDAGCNTGFFSVGAARMGISVVAIDTDPLVVASLWKMASRERLDILPLVVNLAQPSPPTGWRNQEYPSFLDRCRGAFDAVLMLALVHHLIATEGIPLFEIFRLAAEITRKLLVIEYVDPADQMFRCLARGRDYLFRNINRQAFEAAARAHFDILRFQQVGPTRFVYAMAKKINRF